MRDCLASLLEALGELAVDANTEAEVEEVIGPKRDRTAVRHRHERGEVTLGGRRVR